MSTPELGRLRGSDIQREQSGAIYVRLITREPALSLRMSTSSPSACASFRPLSKNPPQFWIIFILVDMMHSDVPDKDEYMLVK